MGADEEGRALATPDFWDSRYAAAASADADDDTTPSHEWFRSFQALQPFFDRHLFCPRPPAPSPHHHHHHHRPPRILHLGSGDSSVPTDLAARGYADQLCVDFSGVVVERMRRRAGAGVRWERADVRAMRGVVGDGSVDVAFDKGTMDAMIWGSPWSPPREVREDTGRYVREVHRVLQDDGVFLYVTYRQPHFIRPLLERDDLWDLEMEVLSAGDSSFDYYGWILRKKKKKN